MGKGENASNQHFLLFMQYFPRTPFPESIKVSIGWLLFPKRQILDSSKLKEFADDNFKFDENSGEFSKRVENTVGKGEIARYKQFLLFPQCFQKTSTANT